MNFFIAVHLPVSKIFPIWNNAIAKLFAVIDPGHYLLLRIVCDFIQKNKNSKK